MAVPKFANSVPAEFGGMDRWKGLGWNEAAGTGAAPDEKTIRKVRTLGHVHSEVNALTNRSAGKNIDRASFDLGLEGRRPGMSWIEDQGVLNEGQGIRGMALGQFQAGQVNEGFDIVGSFGYTPEQFGSH